MKAEIYTNCSLVRIPVVAGEDKYYLPQNVVWAKERVDKILICAPSNACTDPTDGITPIITATDLQTLNAYVNLYDADNRELMHNVSVANLLHINNNPVRVDAVLNLSLSFIQFMTAPVQDGTLLLYVFYKTREEEYPELPHKSVTVQFELQADQEISFRDIINYYMHAIPSRVKGIEVWSQNNPTWITLRDTTYTYQMADIHSELCRPETNGGNAQSTQINPFYLNDLDIDFDYSHIREAAGQTSLQTITFLF